MIQINNRRHNISVITNLFLFVIIQGLYGATVFLKHFLFVVLFVFFPCWCNYVYAATAAISSDEHKVKQYLNTRGHTYTAVG